MEREVLFDYIQDNFKSKPEYLWSKFPSYAVFRHPNSDKWFAVVMNIPGDKFDLNTNEKVDVLNVKVRPEHVGALRLMDGVYPAYHMNKEHWISILLNNSMSENEIFGLLNESYDLTA